MFLSSRRVRPRIAAQLSKLTVLGAASVSKETGSQRRPFVLRPEDARREWEEAIDEYFRLEDDAEKGPSS